jgi:hypothetical protein
MSFHNLLNIKTQTVYITLYDICQNIKYKSKKVIRYKSWFSVHNEKVWVNFLDFLLYQTINDFPKRDSPAHILHTFYTSLCIFFQKIMTHHCKNIITYIFCVTHTHLLLLTTYPSCKQDVHLYANCTFIYGENEYHSTLL